MFLHCVLLLSTEQLIWAVFIPHSQVWVCLEVIISQTDNGLSDHEITGCPLTYCLLPKISS